MGLTLQVLPMSPVYTEYCICRDAGGAYLRAVSAAGGSGFCAVAVVATPTAKDAASRAEAVSFS